MPFRAEARHVADHAEAALVDLWRAYDGGDLTRAEFEQFAADTLAHFNLTAAQAAAVALSFDLRKLGKEVDPLDVELRGGDRDRLQLAFGTVLRNVASPTVDAVSQVRKISRAEPLSSAQDTYAGGLRDQEVGWTRSASSTACEVCQGLADGSVLPPTVEMFHHPGCSCEQVPATTQ